MKDKEVNAKLYTLPVIEDEKLCDYKCPGIQRMSSAPQDQLYVGNYGHKMLSKYIFRYRSVFDQNHQSLAYCSYVKDSKLAF